MMHATVACLHHAARKRLIQRKINSRRTYIAEYQRKHLQRDSFFSVDDEIEFPEKVKGR